MDPHEELPYLHYRAPADCKMMEMTCEMCGELLEEGEMFTEFRDQFAHESCVINFIEEMADADRG